VTGGELILAVFFFAMESLMYVNLEFEYIKVSEM
jgi:hypothetical protein